MAYLDKAESGTSQAVFEEMGSRYAAVERPLLHTKAVRLAMERLRAALSHDRQLEFNFDT